MTLIIIFVTETISRTDEGQPRPKYIFNKCGTNTIFFTSHRFCPSPSPNLKKIYFRDFSVSNLKCAKVPTLVSDMVRVFFFVPESSVLFSITAMLARRARG